MNDRIRAFDTMSRLGRQDWFAFIFVAVIALLFLPLVVFKTVGHGQGDVQVFFRAGWAIWTGHPLYDVTDDHGWSYHYPPTFALLMGPFANPLPGYPQPLWALPYAAAVVVWYMFNFLCLIGALCLWASALERYYFIPAGLGFLRGPSLLRFGPLLALLPFVGDGLARGQPSPMLLLLIVAFFVLYVRNRMASAALLLALAATIKVFPIVFAIIPLLRRDWTFIAWMAGWCGVLLIAVPTICVGPTETQELYRAMWTEHLSGIITGSMSSRTVDEVSPGAYATVSVGSVLARISAGQAFYSSPLPSWASVAQCLFDAVVIVAIAIFGRGGLWSWRGPQPAAGYPILVASAVLLAAMPLMISVAKPNYVTFTVPLMAVFMMETWRRVGQQVITAGMIGWMIIAWTSMIALELPWNWIKIMGPMTWALLLLGPASLSMIGTVSVGRTGVTRTPKVFARRVMHRARRLLVHQRTNAKRLRWLMQVLGRPGSIASDHTIKRIPTQFIEPSELSGKTPKISVVITCFNYQRYIEDTINSVLAQSRPPTEIIVVDDGSTDGTTPFLKDRFGHVDAVQIVTTPNRGQLAAFCEGVRRSTGEVISLLDADDTWDPTYLERVSEELSRRESIDFVMVNMKYFGARSGIMNEVWQTAELGLTSCLTSLSDPPLWIGSPTSGLSIRRSLFERLLLPEVFYTDWKIRADDCLVYGAAILGAHKLYIADALANYRCHDSNNFSNGNRSIVKECIYEMKKERMLNYYRKTAYGSKKPNVLILHLEFKSMSRPSLQRLWKYLRLLPKTRGSSFAKFNVGLRITKYWSRQLLQKYEPIGDSTSPPTQGECRPRS